ncbi:MAG: S1/P1 nuclease [Gammaproteobacteria bacterium]
MKAGIAFLSLVLLSLFAARAMAWDSVGHRVSAAVAYEYLSAETRDSLLEILRAHPRFRQDFEAEIPAFIDRDNEAEFQTWLLGQAAYWPDIARGLPEGERESYNRPVWHYTDGAWVRGAATRQGNIYVGIPPFPAIAGTPATEISNEQDASNVVTALDWNSHVLASTDFSMAQRAVALCWVLHLVGDIHQPLHTGSAYSPDLFSGGDQGGNRIATDAGNFHARWDGAVSNNGIVENTRQILTRLSSTQAPVESDWTQWLGESREILQNFAYSDEIRAAIAQADATGRALQPITLDAGYVNQMRQLGQQRIGLAGLRLASWLESALD